MSFSERMKRVMPRFFVQTLTHPVTQITGADAGHIAKTLRLRPGDEITLSDGAGQDAYGRIVSVRPDCVEAELLRVVPNRTEAELGVTLYAALPKSDGAELIVQKGVELGASRFVFFTSSRTVRRPDSFETKLARLSRIAREAAGQSGRGCIPEVAGLLSFSEAVREAAQADIPLFFYECGGKPVRALYGGHERSCSVVTGPEGGFSPEEAEEAARAGLHVCTLGPRILRCETAPLAALCCVMTLAGEYDGCAPQD